MDVFEIGPPCRASRGPRGQELFPGRPREDVRPGVAPGGRRRRPRIEGGFPEGHRRPWVLRAHGRLRQRHRGADRLGRTGSAGPLQGQHRRR
eukprot:15459222-Alexandrium_andersonii.AAC.1